ncbi:hypothetical protein MKW98_022739, partial [Papaver atlanticum]
MVVVEEEENRKHLGTRVNTKRQRWGSRFAVKSSISLGLLQDSHADSMLRLDWNKKLKQASKNL